MSKGGHTKISAFTSCYDHRKEGSSNAYRNKLIKDYVKARDICLNKYSIEALKEFHAKYKDNYQLPPLPQDDKTLEVALNKMCIGSRGVYPKIRKQAKQWLIDNGYSDVIN